MADNIITPTPENPIPDVDDIKPGIPTPAWPDEGGGGGGATVLTATVSGSTATFPCTAAELFAYMQSGAVVVKFISSNPEDPSDYVDVIHLIQSAQHYSNDSYVFTSNGFEINCATGSDIPSFSAA